VLVASVVILPFVVDASAGSEAASGDNACEWSFDRAEDGTRCWIMVLLTAYLKLGCPPGGDDSEIRERSIEF
jgi:hypothetical protein